MRWFNLTGKRSGLRRSPLALLKEARSDQYHTEYQDAAAHEWRDHVRPMLRGLDLQIADMGEVLGMLRCENGNRERDQPQQNQRGPADDQPVHASATHGRPPIFHVTGAISHITGEPSLSRLSVKGVPHPTEEP